MVVTSKITKKKRHKHRSQMYKIPALRRRMFEPVRPLAIISNVQSSGFASENISKVFTKNTSIGSSTSEPVNDLMSESNIVPDTSRDFVNFQRLNIVAMDCEMVGVGPSNQSALGRCSIVNYNGTVIFDSFVKPDTPITNFRTRWSGIRPFHMKKAKSLCEAVREITQVLGKKIIVGHDLRNDFNVLGITHPRILVRDTSEISLLQLSHTPSLKLLARVFLNRDIQNGPHSSIEDALASLDLYKMFESCWENVVSSVQNAYLSDRFWPKEFRNVTKTPVTPLLPIGFSILQTKCVSIGTDSLQQSMASSTAGSSLSPPKGASKSVCDSDRQGIHDTNSGTETSTSSTHSTNQADVGPGSSSPKDFKLAKNLVFIHCDLVRTLSGKSRVSRCSVVNRNGDILFNSYILPSEIVSDLSFESAGIKPYKMLKAVPIESATPIIINCLSGKRIVGHGLKKQFKSLCLKKDTYSSFDCRDTAKSTFVREKVGVTEHCTLDLNYLSKELLHVEIGQSTLMKVRAIREIYRIYAQEWEESLLHVCSIED